MAENVVINDTTYNGVDTLALIRADGSVATFYPDAVRYNEQTLTEAQQAQARQNIGVGSIDEVAEEVLARLKTPVFGRVDAENNIILTGELVDGEYIVKYEDADGNVVEIGTLEQGDSYENLADPTSSDWLTGQRINSSGSIVTASEARTTNFVPLKAGGVVRVKGLDILYYDSGLAYSSLHLYDSNKNRLGHVTPATEGSFVVSTAESTITWEVKDNLSFSDSIAYARFVGMLMSGYTDNDVIITVDQEITD